MFALTRSAHTKSSIKGNLSKGTPKMITNLNAVTKTYSETEQARSTLEYLLGLVEEQEDLATRREKLICGSTWVTVGDRYAVSSGTFVTAVASIFPMGTEVTFLFKSDTIVSFRYGKDASLSYSMPIQQFLNMFKPVEKKKAGKKETQEIK
jgi:hypothetical protein